MTGHRDRHTFHAAQASQHAPKVENHRIKEFPSQSGDRLSPVPLVMLNTATITNAEGTSSAVPGRNPQNKLIYTQALECNRILNVELTALLQEGKARLRAGQ